MTRTNTTKITTKNSTRIISLNKSPSIICNEFIDANGVRNKGFTCPIQNFVQYFCCNTNNYYFCCTPDRHLLKINSYHEPIYIAGQYQPSNQITLDRNYIDTLINNSRIINKEFILFQKLFLPIFLLSSSILFLIGIALWFWLYKHKVFYALEQDNFNKSNRTVRRTSQSMCNNPLSTKKNTMHLTMERKLRRISYPSTEV
ncbi:unnamed protein product [Rotaria magnacalcarata]|uniref:Shisa N-terminal domain-containing protein n=1 Tax=Rotaria magnacalcarata TaxID=392030 RepID=A0A819NY69_9BILA|nr:unnamed protein product [Rotaria magnacalcarata]CAF1493752.1 unnamed protein product [Rotaria magnacalcarata]CAF2078808.1 unnamed protein product [Rotaria magnacalcarata]CAF2085016.1 unnamed protein product [Rotaria magnacalcarata]CAF2087127.1 unnamed protein product [Rotaria magnacalcarata]